jgi:hypothetical protein
MPKSLVGACVLLIRQGAPPLTSLPQRPEKQGNLWVCQAVVGRGLGTGQDSSPILSSCGRTAVNSLCVYGGTVSCETPSLSCDPGFRDPVPHKKLSKSES